MRNLEPYLLLLAFVVILATGAIMVYGPTIAHWYATHVGPGKP